MEDAVGRLEFLEPLDLSTWNDNQRQIVEHLRDLLVDMNPDQRRMLRLIKDLVNHRILIWTYNEVIQNARNVVRNLTSRPEATP
jgi:hypothetical protein